MTLRYKTIDKLLKRKNKPECNITTNIATKLSADNFANKIPYITPAYIEQFIRLTHIKTLIYSLITSHLIMYTYSIPTKEKPKWVRLSHHRPYQYVNTTP